MDFRRHGDERVPLRHWLYLTIVLSLIGVVHSRDYEEQKVVEQMTRESCIKVMTEAMKGGKIIWPDPHSEIYQMASCEVHETGVRLR